MSRSKAEARQDESPNPRGRGRPRKPTVHLAGEVGSPADGVGSTGEAVARRTPPSAPGPRSAAYFRLERTESGTRLAFVDSRGNPANSDFRRYTGLRREAVRELAARLASGARVLDWEGEAASGDAGSVANPDPRLLDLAAASGMLVDAEYAPLSVDGEERRLVLRVRRQSDGTFSAEPQLDSSDGNLTDDSGPGDGETPRKAGSSTRAVYTVSPCHVVAAHRFLRVRDLGPDWFCDAGLAVARILPKDLAVFLSLVLSRFPGLELRIDGYAVRTAPERAARAALVFREIDEYGYLHIRLASMLEGFPVGFLDDHEITRVAVLDDEERVVNVSDILFTADPAGELRSMLARAGKDARKALFEESGRFILTPELAERFLSEQMASLVQGFALYETAKLARFRVKPVQPRLKLRLASGIDFLSGSAEVEIDGEAMSFARFVSEYRKQSYVTLADGTRGYPDPRSMARLMRFIRRVGHDDETVSVSFFDFPALSRSEGVEVVGEAWSRPEAFYRGYNGIASRGGAFKVEGTSLRPYQEYGVKWLDYLHVHGFGGCLADEMGLGKTIQTIALLRRIYAEGERRPSLVVVPKSLLYNWLDELHRFAPELEVALRYGSDRNRDSTAQIVLTSYAVMRLDIETLSQVDYCYVVLDEAQSIKNLETKTSQAALALTARHKLALSGTPIENSLEELYSLFSFLNPGIFGAESAFLSAYARPIREQGDEDALRDLKARIYPFILRRVKRDVLPELPEKIEQVATVELEPEHLSFYHRRRLELKAEIERAIRADGMAKSSFLVLQAFSELRRLASVPEAEGVPIAASAKREYLREIIPEITAGDHKCLIFTNFLAAVELVSDDLGALGIGNLVMTGATTDRAALVARFQSDPEIKALVMTLKTGGLGLNLTAADYVFIFDPWWNRSAEEQAIDRTHRIGQRNSVFGYRLIARETIEEKILQLQEQKAELVSTLIASDTTAFKSLDEGDIEYLLG